VTLFRVFETNHNAQICGLGGISANAVIASEAKQSSLPEQRKTGLLRRFAPRNDG
jgi:hypothetical protein